jgi:alpha-glucosidase (family GH31 glycosyl hydrolase)
VSSEFLRGEDILVAPVLDERATSRDIYLPIGQWDDKLRSRTIIGPKWLKNYTVALNELAYFTRVPNVTGNPGKSL